MDSIVTPACYLERPRSRTSQALREKPWEQGCILNAQEVTILGADQKERCVWG